MLMNLSTSENTPSKIQYTEQKFQSKYCRYHKNNAHNSDECRKLKKLENERKDQKKLNYLKENPSNTLIHEKTYNQLPKIQIQIHNNPIEMIIDSGANLSYLPSSLLKVDDIKKQAFKTVDSFHQMADGTTTKIEYKMQTSFKIGEQHEVFNHIFCFLETQENCRILGNDFLFSQSTILNYERLFISINGHKHFLKKHDEFYLEDLDKEILEKTKINSISGRSYDKEVNLIKRKLQDMPVAGQMLIDPVKINLVDETPIVTNPYPISMKIRDKVKNELKRLCSLKIIKQSTSNFASPAFFNIKKDGSVRILIDFRKLNKQIQNIPGFFPTVYDDLHILKNKKLFSKIDLKSGYYQIPINHNDSYKLSFITPLGQYEWLTLPFGISIAPKIFQSIMTNILKDFDFVKIYLDDIIIFSDNQDQHLKHILMTLERFNVFNVTPNIEKCEWFVEEIKFLGLLNDGEGLRSDLSRIKESMLARIPTTKRGIQKLCGYINWFRPFVPNISNIVSKLTDLLQDKADIQNNKDTIKEVVSNFSKELMKNIKIFHPDPELPFTLTTDASSSGYGATLTQDKKLVGLISGKFNSFQSRYPPQELELYAIIKALKKFRKLIFGSEIYINTDNKNLLSNTDLNSSKAQRWKILIQEYDIKINYIKGSTNTTSDFLSRLHIISPQFSNLIYENEEFKYITSFIKNDTKELNIPEEESKRFLTDLHYKLGHPGSSIMIKTLQNNVKIDKLNKKCKEICINCYLCQVFKDHKQTYTTIGKAESGHKNDLFSSDILGPYLYSDFDAEEEKGKFYILTIIDLYSRYCQIYLLKSLKEDSLISKLKIHFQKFGTPKRLLTDNGKSYIGFKVASFLQSMHIQHIKTTPYNPKCNGIAERLNKTISTIFRIYRNERKLRDIIKFLN